MKTTTKNLLNAILISGIVLMVVSFNITLLYSFNSISKKNKQITTINNSLISQNVILNYNNNLLIDSINSLNNELIIKDSLLNIVPESNTIVKYSSPYFYKVDSIWILDAMKFNNETKCVNLRIKMREFDYKTMNLMF